MTTRTISAANIAALDANHIKYVLFARLDFSSGVQRYHTEIGPKTAVHPVHGSESYTGIGDFGGISGDVKESVTAAPTGIKLVLTGVNASLINTSITENYYRRDAEVMLGLEDASGNLVDDPVILFSGFMDKIDISLSQGLGQMTLSVESRGTNLLTASDVRFTDEDKQAEVNGDLMAEYVYRMADLQLKWGGVNPLAGMGIGLPQGRTRAGRAER